MGGSMARILVADDEELILLLQESFLRRDDCELLGSKGREETEAKVRADRPDLVVIDAQMEGGSGIEACRSLKTDPELSGLPVVLVTDGSARRACEAAGADAVVARPPRREEILGAMQRFLGFSVRASERRAVSLRVQFFAAGGDGVGYTKDLCAGGLFLKSRESFRAGESLQVIFDLPSPERPTIRADGKVVRRVAADPDSHLIPGIAMRFENLSARDRRDISEYVAGRGEAAP